MRNGPRYVPPGALVEVTARVVGGRYRLTPTRELVARMLGCLGRAMSMFPIQLHAFAFLSNHWHGLMSVPNALALSRFLQRLHSTIGLAVHDVIGWSGRVFQKTAIVLVAQDREDARLKYVLSQRTKERLVSSPLEWPGLNSARAMCGDERLQGEWRDRTLANRLGMRGSRTTVAVEQRVRTVYDIPLTPLPTWRELTEEERQARARALVREITEEVSTVRTPSLGVERVVSQDPMTCGDKPKRRRHAPVIHAEEASERARAVTERCLFTEVYRLAGDNLKKGHSTNVPPQCFPPTSPFGTEPVQIVVDCAKPASI